jgi:predicted O-linked N-acetylglucosamine transferase (SPINDLY family)
MKNLDQLQWTISLIEQGDYRKATNYLEQVLEANPDNSTACCYLVLAYILMGEPEAAEAIWITLLINANEKNIKNTSLQLRQLLEQWIVKTLDNQQLDQAKSMYLALRSIDEEYHNPTLQDLLTNEIIFLGQKLESINKYKEAIEIYLEVLDLNSKQDEVYYRLAYSYYKLEHYTEATQWVHRVIESSYQLGDSHYLMGMIAEELEDHVLANSSYQNAKFFYLNNDNNDANNYYLIGKCAEKLGSNSLASEYYQKAIALEPNTLEFYLSLAEIYEKQQQYEQQITVFFDALIYFPRHTQLFAKLGQAYLHLGQTNLANYYLGYSHYYSDEVGNLTHALEHLKSFFDNCSNHELVDFNFYRDLSKCYLVSNYTKDALDILRLALDLFENNKFTINRLIQSIFPIVYSSLQEINFYRQNFAFSLAETCQLKPISPSEKIDFLESLITGSNFYLSYQGRNDTILQKRYGKYVQDNLKKILPEWTNKNGLAQKCENLSSRKIRIGLVSFRLRGLGLLYVGWVRYLNHERFHVTVYDFINSSKKIDAGLVEDFTRYCDRLVTISTNCLSGTDIANRLTNDNLDILIYPELGLDPILNFLCHLRLAPIQCTTWAHPITSGSPAIDYYLSSELMEPPNAQRHYTEKLVNLPNLAFPLPTVDFVPDNKSRINFGLENNTIIYLCSQSLFKYLPQHDKIFAEIAKRGNNFCFVFVDPPNGPLVTTFFRQRLQTAFAHLDLDYQNYCHFLPRLNNADFMNLNLVADVFLDCLSWSGGLTTRHAISCNLPVVTCPGKFMRARHSYAMLKMIDVKETIANSAEEYIQIAVNLGLDHEWREQIRSKMGANKHKLFNDQNCVPALESFFLEALEQVK